MMITAEQVRELREQTGAGLMDCKRALTEVKGDLQAAMELLRIKGQASAGKKAARVAAEGIVTIAMSSDAKTAAIVDTNCETDFVARDASFVQFANQVADTALANKQADIEALLAHNDGALEAARAALVAKIGENIQVRRAASISTEGILGSYVHGGRIGVVVELKGGTVDLAKDLAMHIAASNPQVVRAEDVSAESIAKEREIVTAQALESGKPKEIVEKMVDGRIKKYVDEISLMGQPFVKDPNMTVATLCKQANATVVRFVRFEVGEGIEKKVENFAEEVMAQARGA